MKFEEYQEKLSQLKKLLEYANTGSPKQLAKTLNVSERTARRLVEKLKLENGAIFFCRKSNTYMIRD
jgi:DNA-binding transcriptional regulator LsrR (DeoR family)